jgi:hypothetical protein
MNAAQASQQEIIDQHHHHLICWKSVSAGVLISIMSYLILTSLGAGIAGLTASHVINNEEGGSALATGAGLWLGLTATISLFMGSYFALRISNFKTNRIGAAHGFVVASIFFILLMWGATSTIGSLTTGIGKMASSLSVGAASLANSPVVEDTIQKSFVGSNLKSDPKTVAQGIALRLLQGDTESAKNYYAYQTDRTPAEAEAKFTQMKSDFDQKVKSVLESAANATADAGWSLFVTFLVGLISAVIGGRVGAHANLDRPMARVSNEKLRTEFATQL